MNEPVKLNIPDELKIKMKSMKNFYPKLNMQERISDTTDKLFSAMKIFPNEILDLSKYKLLYRTYIGFSFKYIIDKYFENGIEIPDITEEEIIKKIKTTKRDKSTDDAKLIFVYMFTSM